MKQKEPNRKDVIDGMQEERIKKQGVAGNLSIMIVTILTMTQMSGCAASLTDFGYEGGPTTTININQTINDGFGEPWNIPTNFWPYNPYSTVYSPYSGTFSSSRQYWPK